MPYKCEKCHEDIPLNSRPYTVGISEAHSAPFLTVILCPRCQYELRDFLFGEVGGNVKK